MPNTNQTHVLQLFGDATVINPVFVAYGERLHAMSGTRIVDYKVPHHRFRFYFNAPPPHNAPISHSVYQSSDYLLLCLEEKSTPQDLDNWVSRFGKIASPKELIVISNNPTIRAAAAQRQLRALDVPDAADPSFFLARLVPKAFSDHNENRYVRVCENPHLPVEINKFIFGFFAPENSPKNNYNHLNEAIEQKRLINGLRSTENPFDDVLAAVSWYLHAGKKQSDAITVCRRITQMPFLTEDETKILKARIAGSPHQRLFENTISTKNRMAVPPPITRPHANAVTTDIPIVPAPTNRRG